jgi:hypothetical protein
MPVHWSVYHDSQKRFSNRLLTSDNATALNYPGRDGRRALHEYFNGDERDRTHTEQHEECNNTSVAPSVREASILQGKKKTDDAWNNKKFSQEIQVFQSFDNRHIRFDWGKRLQDEEDDEQSESADWKIDCRFQVSSCTKQYPDMESLAVKTPAPRHVGGESSSEKRSDDPRNTHHSRVAPSKSV